MSREPFGVETAILLMGYGSPAQAEDIPEYLADVLGGRRPSPGMVREYERRYTLIGGSPQLGILRSLRTKLERRLQSDREGIRVYLGMKHFRPHLTEVIPEAARDGFRRLVAVPLSPYDSPWILQPYERGIAVGRARADPPVTIEMRAGWHRDPHLIGYWATAIQRSLQEVAEPNAVILLSAHSLPERRQEAGDPYPKILQETARRIARTAHLASWDFTYQSAGNTTEPWLRPDITEKMVEWRQKGSRHQLVAAFGFLFDHLEILYDLDVVAREFAERHNVDYRRVPMPNDDDQIVEALRTTAGA